MFFLKKGNVFPEKANVFPEKGNVFPEKTSHLAPLLGSRIGWDMVR